MGWGGLYNDDHILGSVASKILKTPELSDNLLTKEYQLILSVLHTIDWKGNGSVLTNKQFKQMY